MANFLDAFQAERAELFANLSEETAAAHWAKHGFAPPVDRKVLLAMAHRARLRWIGATDEMLAESVQWLKENREHTKGLMGGSPPLNPMTRDFRRMQRGMAPLIKKAIVR